jgi:CRP/FNR family cyclic AMP-dependent transcriptional regulator
MIRSQNLMNWIDSLPSDIIAEIHKGMTTCTLQDKESLYRPGDIICDLYQIIEGECRIVDYSYDGKEVLIFNVGKGDSVGEISLIDGMQVVTLVEACGPVKIGALKKQKFDELCMRYPQILQVLIRSLCSRLRYVATLYKEISMLSLHQRLARTLHRIAQGSHQDQDRENRITLGISQTDLSRMLAVSRQSVSKELKNLENEGMIDIEYGKVLIKDLDKLRLAYENLC